MEFNEILIKWYDQNKRSLPWRETTNPYHIWLSEIILQQTQVNQGLPYYYRFLEKYPTVHDLAMAEETEVLNLWQGLGYYSRARNLHETSKFISKELNGEFPNEYKSLIKLKGIGDYTASAIASFCFDRTTPVVDGNVYRFLSRYFGIKTPINTSPAKKEFKQLAFQLIDEQNPSKFNQAIMEFGALLCKPQNPDCMSCPFGSSCVALEKNLVNVLPIKNKKKSIKIRHFNFLVFLSDDNKTYLEQRDDSGIWKKLYQFPLVETHEEASLGLLKKENNFRELVDNLNYDISLYNQSVWVHKLSHQHLYTKFWIITLKTMPFKGIPIEDIQDYPVPVLINNFIETFKSFNPS